MRAINHIADQVQLPSGVRGFFHARDVAAERTGAWYAGHKAEAPGSTSWNNGAGLVGGSAAAAARVARVAGEAARAAEPKQRTVREQHTEKLKVS